MGALDQTFFVLDAFILRVPHTHVRGCRRACLCLVLPAVVGAMEVSSGSVGGVGSAAER